MCNDEIFTECARGTYGVPDRTIGNLTIQPLPLETYGLEYDANWLFRGNYLSDSGGRGCSLSSPLLQHFHSPASWHMLVHPCHGASPLRRLRAAWRVRMRKRGTDRDEVGFQTWMGEGSTREINPAATAPEWVSTTSLRPCRTQLDCACAAAVSVHLSPGGRSLKYGHVKGQSVKFVRGHANRGNSPTPEHKAAISRHHTTHGHSSGRAHTSTYNTWGGDDSTWHEPQEHGICVLRWPRYPSLRQVALILRGLSWQTWANVPPD